MAKELEKNYNPAEIEPRLYEKWVANKYFHAEVDRSKKPFTIVMPPPNITGQLHMGHALDNTMQDILIRFKRMQGYNALWQPGTDHAAIATEVKVIEALKKEGIDKEDLGREKFLERVWDWRREYGGKIVNQLKKMGSSADWDRERFTMDEGNNKAVTEVFCKLYEKGYMYRGSRIVNWCPVCQTSISDAEVVHEEQDGFFWHINYPVVGEEGRFVEIATTRPETLLGDTAVAVNPEDERYKDIVGKMLKLPLTDREIPVIADEYVDKDFGTGCVKITPAHDPNDFEVGKRHNLEEINIMNDDATINKLGGKYAGMDRYEARKAMVADLDALGLLVKVVPHKHMVGTHDRCKTTVEPLVKPQWFVKMSEMAKPAKEAVVSGKLKLIPERMDKTYYNWLDNIRDWCVSRQLWWGHRIPAYYCQDCGETIVSKETVCTCPKCGSNNVKQDEDTLDTWFSSALWPFSTLGWPDKTEDLDYFFPTDVLVTGYDIIFFWVIRMVFSSIEQTGKLPFHTVLFHGLVRDDQGRKMSKSLGNGIDPLEVIDKYGADALRFTLITGNAPGNDMRFYWERVEASRNFANKIWNATRFAMMNLDDDITINKPAADGLEAEDKWLLSLYNRLVSEVTENLEKYELGIAVSKLYDFIWDVLCDWYIELVKPRLSAKGTASNRKAQEVLVYVISHTMELLHPFMPFITEEIWQTLPHDGESIVIAPYPKYDASLDFPEAEKNVTALIAAIRAVRTCRSDRNVPPSRKTHIYIKTDSPELFEGCERYFTSLASATGIQLINDESSLPNCVQAITDKAVLYIPTGEMVDPAEEKARLEKELAKAEKDIQVLGGKLKNASFVEKAPAAVVEAERVKLAKAEAVRENVIEALKAYN